MCHYQFPLYIKFQSMQIPLRIKFPLKVLAPHINSISPRAVSGPLPSITHTKSMLRKGPSGIT